MYKSTVFNLFYVLGLKAVPEDQFESEMDTISLSGSESESESDILSEQTFKHPKIFYTHLELPDKVYSIHKTILPDFKLKSSLKWAIFMMGGGHFAGAIFDKNQAILHKTFHCYTVRAKQGGSQGSADNKSGSSHPKSAGASLRRYNEAKYQEYVQDILTTWKAELAKCSLVFYRAVSSNKRILFGKIGKDEPVLNKNDDRILTIPFPTRRATFKEVKRVHEQLMTIEIHSETVEDLKNKLLNKSDHRSSRNTGPNRNKKSQIRRSKSRDSPVRKLPDFVQSLADEANSTSEEETGTLLASDLTEFEVTKKPESKKQISHVIEMQNSLVTACKSGDAKLFSLLLKSNEKLVIDQLNQPMGDAKVTLLHLASKEGHGKIIQLLLDNGADPVIRDKAKKTAYSYCPDKNSRTAFRKFQASNPDQWDYIKAGLPSGPLLTSEEEARQASKKAEKKKAQREAKKEKDKIEKAKLQEVQAENAEKQRFLGLSDREKRALAAEKRMLAQRQDLPSVPRCFQCGVDMSGKVPFEYSGNRFCKPACVKEHRKSTK